MHLAQAVLSCTSRVGSVTCMLMIRQMVCIAHSSWTRQLVDACMEVVVMLSNSCAGVPSVVFNSSRL